MTLSGWVECSDQSVTNTKSSFGQIVLQRLKTFCSSPLPAIVFLTHFLWRYVHVALETRLIVFFTAVITESKAFLKFFFCLDKENKYIFIFKKLDQPNIWHYCLINDSFIFNLTRNCSSIFSISTLKFYESHKNFMLTCLGYPLQHSLWSHIHGACNIEKTDFRPCKQLKGNTQCDNESI